MTSERAEEEGEVSPALARLDQIARQAASPPPVAAEEWGQVWGSIRSRTIDPPADARTDEAWLGRYLDGELGAEGAAAVERVAPRDPTVRASLDRLRRLDEVAGEAASPPPVDDATWAGVWERIASAISPRARRSRRGVMATGWQRVAGSLAAAATVAAVALPLALTPSASLRPAEPALYVARIGGEVESFVDAVPEEPTLAFLDTPGANDMFIETLEAGGAYSSAVLYSSGPVVIDLRGGL